MGWTVYGTPWETGELANTNKFQTVIFNDDIILRAIRTWVIVYNDPTFTDLTMKIYSNDVVSSLNTPKKLLATSTTTHLKSAIHTEDNAVKEIYFEFDYFPCNSVEKYNFVINGAGYTYSAGSHLAWKQAWPDPVYTTNFTPNLVNLGASPYALYAIGGQF